MRYVQFLIHWCEVANLHVITGRFTMFCTEVCIAMQLLRGPSADLMIICRDFAGQEVEKRARELLAWPPVKELDLPSVGKPARQLLEKLGLSA